MFSNSLLSASLSICFGFELLIYSLVYSNCFLYEQIYSNKTLPSTNHYYQQSQLFLRVVKKKWRNHSPILHNCHVHLTLDPCEDLEGHPVGQYSTDESKNGQEYAKTTITWTYRFWSRLVCSWKSTPRMLSSRRFLNRKIIY